MALSDQQLVNDRIAELMAEEPVNEMRASSPDVFQRQEQAIESFLGGIGQFANEKNIPFLKALAKPNTAKRYAEGLSFGADMTPILGDIQAIREGSRMMGDDQPLMGGAFIGGSLIGLPSNKLKGLLRKANEKLDDFRTRRYQAESKMKPGLSKADFDEGWKDNNKIQSEINKTKKEIMQIESALGRIDTNTRYLSYHPTAKKPKFTDKMGREIDPKTVLPLSDNLSAVRKLQNTPKQMRDENLKGIVNANAETRKLYQEIIDSPSRINTKDHQKVAKEMSEQRREINKGVNNADLDDRNEIIRLLAQLKDKKPK
jgi:hypothetical protein